MSDKITHFYFDLDGTTLYGPPSIATLGNLALARFRHDANPLRLVTDEMIRSDKVANVLAMGMRGMADLPKQKLNDRHSNRKKYPDIVKGLIELADVVRQNEMEPEFNVLSGRKRNVAHITERSLENERLLTAFKDNNATRIYLNPGLWTYVWKEAFLRMKREELEADPFVVVEDDLRAGLSASRIRNTIVLLRNNITNNPLLLMAAGIDLPHNIIPFNDLSTASQQLRSPLRNLR